MRSPPSRQPSRPHLRILVVEDHNDTLRSVAFLLERHGYIVSGAATMEQALRLTRECPIDVLICDIALPDGDGWELMSTLRRRGPLTGIAISGLGSDEDILRSTQAGFSCHLIKPFEAKQLCLMLREIENGLHARHEL